MDLSKHQIQLGPGLGERPIGANILLGFPFRKLGKNEHNVMLLSCLHTKTISTHKQSPWFSSKTSFVGHMGLAAMLYPNTSSLLTLQLDFFFFFNRGTFPLVFSVSSLPPYKYSFLPCLMHSKLKKFRRGKVIGKKPKIKEPTKKKKHVTWKFCSSPSARGQKISGQAST